MARPEPAAKELSVEPDELLSADELLDFYGRMATLRFFEDKVHDAFQRGLVFGTTHLARGQEAAVVGTVLALRPGDSLTYTYRGHNQVIARGMSPEAAFAEIFGRESGCSRGLGGSMHLADTKLGLLGSFAIVGAGLPVAVGAAISAQLDGRGDVAMTFFGDGSTNIGAFHESMNLAAVWKLPIVFVCENNLYGEYSPILSTTPFADLARRADAYAMPAEIVDGNDVVAVHRAATAAVARARAGDGPAFLELKTYRQSGHSRSDPAKYRPPGELEAWLARDPLLRCAALLREKYRIAQERIDAVTDIARDLIERAYTAAEAGAWPEVRDLGRETYVEEVRA